MKSLVVLAALLLASCASSPVAPAGPEVCGHLKVALATAANAAAAAVVAQDQQPSEPNRLAVAQTGEAAARARQQFSAAGCRW